MTKLILGLTLGFTAFTAQAQTASGARCSAICMYYNGASFFQTTWKLFVRSYSYGVNGQPFRIEANSYQQLARHCAGGHLLSSYAAFRWVPSQATPNQIVDEGNYVKDPVEYDAHKLCPDAMPTVVDTQAAPQSVFTTDSESNSAR